jgi:hypothetical protein
MFEQIILTYVIIVSAPYYIHNTLIYYVVQLFDKMQVFDIKKATKMYRTYLLSKILLKTSISYKLQLFLYR